MSPVQTTAVVLDPMGDVARSLGRIEDWLLVADPDSFEAFEAEIVVRAGAAAAGAVALAVAEAFEAAPSLYAPEGYLELAPLRSSPGTFEALLPPCTGRCVPCLTHSPPPTRFEPSTCSRAALCALAARTGLFFAPWPSLLQGRCA